MIIRPATEEGVEGIDELLWSSTRGLFAAGADRGREGLEAGLARSEPQFGRFPIAPLVLAHGLPSEVKALGEGSEDGLFR